MAKVWPLVLGETTEFERVRDFLVNCGYTEEALCARCRLSSLDEFSVAPQRASADSRHDDLVGLLARLFFLGEYVQTNRLHSLIPGEAMDALNALGLLNESADKSGATWASVALYPAHGLYFTSERLTNPDRSPIELFDDIVFPAISRHTYQFLASLPSYPCENFLDLCSGTGVAALVAASKYAKHAWAIDITERATQCAEFNRRLNGLDNVTVLQGNLYEPVSGMTFDRIVAHPPYVPVLKPSKIYYDGGEDGERVTRAIVQGLPRHLSGNGRFYCVTMGVEREDEPFEQRARTWLGKVGSDYDLLCIVMRTEDLRDFSYQATVTAGGGWGEVDRWRAHFERLKISNFAHGSLVILRKNGQRPPFTLRRKKGAHSGPAEAEWLLGWEAVSGQPERLSRLLDSCPRATQDVELRVTHRPHQGTLVPSEFDLVTDYPFSMECKIQPWMAMLVARCDGKASVRELFESCKNEHLIHAETPESEFLRLLKTFISGGFLTVSEFELPLARNSQD